MLKRFVQRIACGIMVILLLCSLLAPSTIASEELGNEYVDFALVLDCSRSMQSYDPYRLSVSACKMFMDMMPLANIRISVVTYGYKSSDLVYQFNTDDDFFSYYSTQYVHALSELSELPTAAKKNTKTAIENTFGHYAFSNGNEKIMSPMGSALTAAVDLLKTSGTTKKNGGILVLSDGQVSSEFCSAPTEDKYLAAAVDIAKNNEWPIFSVMIDSKQDDYAVCEERMKKMATGTNGQFYSLSNADQLSTYFIEIFDKFVQIEAPIQEAKLDDEGKVVTSLTVDELTAEATFTVTGGNVTQVLIDTPTNGKITVDKSFENDTVYAVMESEHYVTAKLIAPKAGEYKVTILGDSNASVTVYNCSLSDVDMNLNASSGSVVPQDGTFEQPFEKSSPNLAINVGFSYGGRPVDAPTFCDSFPAVLEIMNTTTGMPVILDNDNNMMAKDGRYYCEIDLSRLPEGNYDAYATIEHEKFHSGHRESNVVHFGVINKPVILQEGNLQDIKLSTYINSEFDRVDLNNIFYSTDGDEIIYSISPAKNNRDVSFDYTVDAGYMTINSGMVPGENFEVAIFGRDVDTPEEEAASFDILLTVINRPLERTDKKIKDFSLWYTQVPRWLPFADNNPEKLKSTLKLNEFFIDPDGLPVQCTFEVTGDKDAVSIEQDGNDVRIVPLKKGTVHITLTATDGVDTVTESFDVESKSGVGEYWLRYGIFYIIFFAVLLIILIVIIIAFRSRLAGGVWDITFNYLGSTASTGENGYKMAYLRVSKKGKFDLADMLTAVYNSYLDILPGNPLNNLLATTGSLVGWFGGVRPVMKGRCFGKKGGTVMNVQKSDILTVSCNSIPFVGKKKITTSGAFRFEVNHSEMGNLSIEMRLR